MSEPEPPIRIPFLLTRIQLELPHYFAHRYGAKAFLDFLTLSRAAHKPQTGLVVPLTRDDLNWA